MKFIREQWLSIFTILVTTAIVGITYDSLPQRIATHWNWEFKADAYSDKWPAAFYGPLFSIALLVLFRILPLFDPQKGNYDRFHKPYNTLQRVLVVFFCGISLLPVLVAKGYISDPSKLIFPGVALMLAILGNYMGQLKQNWYAGIRTPWTLSNETVWNKTHRFGGKLWLACGILAFFASFMPTPANKYLFSGFVGIMGVIPIVYSYVIFKQEMQGRK